MIVCMNIAWGVDAHHARVMEKGEIFLFIITQILTLNSFYHENTCLQPSEGEDKPEGEIGNSIVVHPHAKIK